jgi:predicted nicotinamide N-methyase
MALSYAEEGEYLRALREKRNNVPYGVALWPSAIALAHELAARAESGELTGKRVLELGSGTGLPGIVAAAVGGADVVQTDSSEIALDLCRRNAHKNGVTNITYRQTDWANWGDTGTYDGIIGSDILYAEPMHGHLRNIFLSNLAPGGTLLIADPFRAPSLRLLESMEAEGWQVSFTKWNLGEDTPPRPIGVFQLRR